MKISTKNWVDNLVWVLTVCLIASYLILYEEAWGRYVYLGLSVLIAMLAVVKNQGVLAIRITPFLRWMLLFVIFAFSSSLWAKYNSDSAFSQGVSLLLIGISLWLVYFYYEDQRDVHTLLTAIMWGGYTVAIYTLLRYGYGELQAMAAESDLRMENEFANVNAIGMLVAYACVFQIHELLHRRRPWTALLLIPAILVIAATQSRKAFVLLIGGGLAACFLNSATNKHSRTRIAKAVTYTAMMAVVLFLLLQLPVFEGVRERMDSMVAALFGWEGADSSAITRVTMRKVGWEVFTQNPLLGIGLDNGRYALRIATGNNTYLHNNYVELLAGGGLIGFFCYYSAHIYLLKRLFRYRKGAPEGFAVGVIWLGCVLVMDYGQVTYYEKADLFFMMAQFLNVQYMKKQYEEVQYEAQETMAGGEKVSRLP